MGFINQIFQIIWLAIPAGGGKEIRHLVAERSIVRMLLNCHQLNRIVAIFDDARDDIIGEFAVSAYATFLLRHTDMRLVNQQLLIFLRFEFFIRPAESLIRRPNFRYETTGGFILHDARSVKWDTVKTATVAAHLDFHFLAMFQRIATFEFNLPDTVIQTRHRVRTAIPVIEVANQMHRICARRPLTVNPAIICARKTKVHVAIREGR